MKLQHGQWVIEISDAKPDNVFISREDNYGSIHIRSSHEAYVVDVWSEGYDRIVAGCVAVEEELK